MLLSRIMLTSNNLKCSIYGVIKPYIRCKYHNIPSLVTIYSLSRAVFTAITALRDCPRNWSQRSRHRTTQFPKHERTVDETPWTETGYQEKWQLFPDKERETILYACEAPGKWSALTIKTGTAHISYRALLHTAGTGTAHISYRALLHTARTGTAHISYRALLHTAGTEAMMNQIMGYWITL